MAEESEQVSPKYGTLREDYFQLKAKRTHQTQEKLFTAPELPKININFLIYGENLQL